MTKTSWLAATVVAIAVSGAALSMAMANDESTTRTPPSSDPVARLAPELPRLIAAFRREQRSSDQLPGDPAGAIETGDRQPGESPGLARTVGVADGSAIHLWPASGSVCLSHAWSGGCVRTHILAQQGAIVGTRFLATSPASGAPVYQAVVLARDGVNEVEVLTANGARVIASTGDNAAVVDLPAEAVAAEWENIDGTRGVQRLQAPAMSG